MDTAKGADAADAAVAADAAKTAKSAKEVPVRSLSAEKLAVHIYASRTDLGRAAAFDVAAKLRQLLATASRVVNIIFAAAPSQNEFLQQLVLEEGIDWSRVNAFHMDEYVGVGKSSPQSFASFLSESIFDKLPFRAVHYILGDSNDATAEAERYARLLKDNPVDIVCMGIGENTHIAFNDPHIADFKDPYLVKIVELDEASRKQQVNDGCFPSLSDVPVKAITLTVPALLAAGSVFCMVPGPTKTIAVHHTIHQHKSEAYPSTALRSHTAATLYLDTESAGRL